MPRRGIAAACVVLAALFAAPVAAQAVTPNPFYGVVGVHVPNQAELNRVAAAGAGTYRIQVDWRFIEPRPGFPNWGPTDLFFAQAALAGVNALPDLLGVPKWISRRERDKPPLGNARQRAAWTALLSDLAHRYGSSGTFWAAPPELPRRTITTWEIWHEPNVGVFFGGKPSPAKFAKLLAISSAALKGADPTAQVVRGGGPAGPGRERRDLAVRQRKTLVRHGQLLEEALPRARREQRLRCTRHPSVRAQPEGRHSPRRGGAPDQPPPRRGPKADLGYRLRLGDGRAWTEDAQVAGHPEEAGREADADISAAGGQC